jgi:mannose-6-phosphate isomerase-like protein (cupin superfamily)
MRLLLAVAVLSFLAVQVAPAKDPDGFAIWKQSDFQAHEKVLSGKIGPDHSARETLGEYGGHMVRMIHRVATGAPEFHANFVDLWIVESGKGTVVVGGSLTDAKPMGSGDASRGEMTGSGISGGERHEMSAGDVIHIPANTPHWAVVPEGGEITYLRIAIPAK